MSECVWDGGGCVIISWVDFILIHRKNGGEYSSSSVFVLALES